MKIEHLQNQTTKSFVFRNFDNLFVHKNSTMEFFYIKIILTIEYIDNKTILLV